MKLRFLNVHTVTPEQLVRWERWLAPEKRQRLDRLPPAKRLQSLCGDGLARELLAEMLGIAPEGVVFSCTEKGKPVTDGACFNISHSGAGVVCAVSAQEVGVDIEAVRPVPPRLGRALESWQTEKEFWQLWTQREATLKCCGDGLGAWKRSGGEEEQISCFEFPGYVVAVCEKK